MRRTLILAAAMAALAWPAAAQSDNVGAPSSAAGGVHTEPLSPSSSSLPSSAGPLGGAPSLRPGNRLPSPDLPSRTIEPGTGKYRPPAGVPCSVQVQPDRQC